MSMNWNQQITAIEAWQINTGNTGAPPKSVNARLANWVRWAVRQAQSNASLAAEMESLGIDVERAKYAPRHRDRLAAKQALIAEGRTAHHTRMH